MHVVEIKDLEHYAKALGVLIEVGGTFQGRGPAEKPYIIVNEAQYKALVRAKVVNGKGTKKGGKKTAARESG